MEESIQIDSHAGKKPRMTDTDKNGEDIISNLPESIISRILSVLPTKDALRTCVLSKDWEYKWTSVYNIDIIGMARFLSEMNRKTNIVNFVDRIFIFSRTSILKRFRLSCQQECDASHIMTWISAALMRNVEDLEIACHCEGGVLPRRLFDRIPLTKLKLILPCTFRPVQNLFSNLKVLHLYRVEILNDRAPRTSQLTFNFPLLETFELGECKWLKVNFVEIKAPALTEFRVMHYFYLSELENCNIKISGAKLLKIWLHGHLIENFDVSASLIFSAVVDFRSSGLDLQGIRENGSRARLLLNGCSSLNHLQLSGDTVEAIAKSKQGSPLPKLNMLKRLEILTKCKSRALLQSLHMMPFLESIVLDMRMWKDYKYDLVESIPSCIVSHLKEVGVYGFQGERSHVHLADFLLKNALELRKMSGLSRKKSEERRVDKYFWARLRRVFRDGGFELDSWTKNMTDFESRFG